MPEKPPKTCARRDRADTGRESPDRKNPVDKKKKMV
jgi:hypothetical protein